MEELHMLRDQALAGPVFGKWAFVPISAVRQAVHFLCLNGKVLLAMLKFKDND